METNKCTCPHCQQDITELVEGLVKLRLKQINAEKARRSISPEQRAKSLAESIKRIKKWGEENPEKVRASALNASKSRTAESFARQRETVKETIMKKNIKFAELLFTAREQGQQITPELETQLLQKAAQIVKEENKQAKKLAKKAAKKAAKQQAE